MKRISAFIVFLLASVSNLVLAFKLDTWTLVLEAGESVLLAGGALMVLRIRQLEIAEKALENSAVSGWTRANELKTKLEIPNNFRGSIWHLTLEETNRGVTPDRPPDEVH